MTNVEEFLQGSSGSSVICLQLKKPKNWNWEISTSKSSPHIALPTIQLFNSKGKLLVETNDNGTTHRQTWNSSSSSFQIGKNSGFLQRSKSDNLEKKLVANNFRSPTLITVSEKIPTNKCDTGKNNLHIQRCRSDSIALRTSHQHQHQINKNNLEIPKNYELKKSRSDVIDIKVKPKLFHSASERKKSYNNNYYYRRSQSDDLIQKTKQKYDLEQSRKRAEADGYMKIIQQDLEEKNMRKKCLLATAETVVYHSNNKSATTLEVKEVVKPKKYVLRQSRAGILVLTDDDDETFHSSHLHRKRCHGEYEDCRYDKNDVHIQGELPSLENNFLYTPRRSKSSKEFSRKNIIINNNRNDQHHHHQEYPKKKSDQTNLFYSKSDIFPFQNVLMNKSNNNKLDENSNYLINEPLTTPDDEIIEEKFGKELRHRKSCDDSNPQTSHLSALVAIRESLPSILRVV